MDNFGFNFNMPNSPMGGMFGANNQVPVTPNAPNQLQSYLPQHEFPTPMFNNPEEPAVIYEPINPEFVMMEKEVLLKYLQNLLKLPDSIDKFINQLKTNPKNAHLLAQIIKQNLVDVKGLNEFLNKNSADAIQKLYSTIMEVMKSGSGEITQLKDLAAILNFLQTSTNLNPNSIKEFLLLYLPLDIKEFQNLNSGAVEGSEGLTQDENYDITIMIQTVNFSNVLASVKEDGNDLFIKLNAEKDFPYEKFAKIISYMAAQLTLNIELEHQIIPKSDKKNDKQSFNVASSGSIPINALILAQFIIKSIFKIDKDFSAI